jgi:hypothetical protein
MIEAFIIDSFTQKHFILNTRKASQRRNVSSIL